MFAIHTRPAFFVFPVIKRVAIPAAAASLALLLSACATSQGTVAGGPRPGKAPSSSTAGLRQPSQVTRDPRFQAIPGVEGVIGANRGQLVRQFGEPRLDVWEGDARKLQFTGTACLMDIYLYPTTTSKEPLASYVDARRASDGQDVDRAACIAALRKR